MNSTEEDNGISRKKRYDSMEIISTNEVLQILKNSLQNNHDQIGPYKVVNDIKIAIKFPRLSKNFLTNPQIGLPIIGANFWITVFLGTALLLSLPVFLCIRCCWKKHFKNLNIQQKEAIERSKQVIDDKFKLRAYGDNRNMYLEMEVNPKSGKNIMGQAESSKSFFG